MALGNPEMMAAIAVTRFGLGARPGEIAAAKADPQGFLKAQIRRSGADQPVAQGATAQRMAEFRDAQRERREARLEKAADSRPGAGTGPGPGGDPGMAAKREAPDPVKQVGAMLRRDISADFEARADLAATTDAAFRERWALFWANHFTVSATKAITGTVIGPFEAEAIRPHVFGR
ncbi:MAG: DUF1800 family protein, partial [Proteobacteria bacterium]|nr:DUF1800 family protein [Pseudomonadota bacterium]